MRKLNPTLRSVPAQGPSLRRTKRFQALAQVTVNTTREGHGTLPLLYEWARFPPAPGGLPAAKREGAALAGSTAGPVRLQPAVPRLSAACITIAIIIIIIIIIIMMLVIIIGFAALRTHLMIDSGALTKNRALLECSRLHFSRCACHPCAGAMLVFSASF